MNRPTIDELVEKDFEKLPESVRVLFDSPSTNDTIESITKKLNLAPFERDQLTIEIGYVLFGVTKIDGFKNAILESIIINDETARYIESECKKEIFNKMRSNQDSLNHQDILSEIENPTPSITPKEPVPQTEVKTLDEEVKKPTLEEALSGVLPNEGGFSVGDTSHPAEKVAQKLNDKLSTPTTTIPKEIYVVKKPDPYHEPIE